MCSWSRSPINCRWMPPQSSCSIPIPRCWSLPRAGAFAASTSTAYGYGCVRAMRGRRPWDDGSARALDLRDKETEGHSRRVTERTVRLAQAMGLGNAELVHIRRGALLHDIGKMGVPDRILLKPGPLTEDEWSIMRWHPVYAY